MAAKKPVEPQYRNTTPKVDASSRLKSADRLALKAKLEVQQRQHAVEVERQAAAPGAAAAKRQALLEKVLSRPVTAYAISYEGDKIGHVLTEYSIEDGVISDAKLVDYPDMKSVIIERLRRILVRL